MNSITLKKIVLWSLLTFWAATTVILALGLHDSKNNGTAINQGSNAQTQKEILTVSAVADHAAALDCWIIISNKVYNVTTYLDSHPGGPEAITPYCGKDATIAFETKDKPNPAPHSQSAADMLISYYVGDLNKAASNQTIPTTHGTVNNFGTTQNTASPSNTGGTTVIKLTTAVVAAHNTPSDCWVIINNKVYGLSNYLNAHPGNANTITPYCGKDGTTAFDTKDKSKPKSHSQYANSLLANYYIGDLNATATNQTIQNTINAAPKAPANQQDEDDD